MTYSSKNWDNAPVRVEKVSDLVLDWRLYPRMEVDHKDVVRSYARAMKAGCVFPTIKVGLFSGKKIIVDGVHRVSALKLNKIDHADCSELPFNGEAELFAEAVKFNSSHGKAFSEVELKENIRRLQKYKFSVKDIVTLTHVPTSEIYHETVAPITVLKAPCGKNIYCTGQPNGQELVAFKKALMLIRDVARSGCIPTDDELFKNLILECRLALGKVKFNG